VEPAVLNLLHLRRSDNKLSEPPGGSLGTSKSRGFRVGRWRAGMAGATGRSPLPYGPNLGRTQRFVPCILVQR